MRQLLVRQLPGGAGGCGRGDVCTSSEEAAVRNGDVVLRKLRAACPGGAPQEAACGGLGHGAMRRRHEETCESDGADDDGPGAAFHSIHHPNEPSVEKC